MPVNIGQDRHLGTVLGDPGRADEDRVNGTALNPLDLERGLEGVQLAPEGVALGEHVEDPEVRAVEDDHAGTGTEDRRACGRELAERLPEALALDAESHHGRLAARKHQRIETLEISRHAYLPRRSTEAPEHALVRLEPSLQGEDPDEWCRACRRRAHQPR